MYSISCQSPLSDSPVEEGNHYVYVLPTSDGSRLKIGRSRSPLRRILSLCCLYPDIDLARSVIVAVDDHRVEKALHTAFGNRRQAQPGRKDGHTEWFAGDFLEDVLSLVRVIAAHRKTIYREFRNVEVLLREYLVSHPNAGERPPRRSKAERIERAPLVEALLTESILERAQVVIDRLDERAFDSVLRHGNRAYLTRTVRRDDEPECWLTEGGHRTSDWGRRLGELGLISVSVDGGSCLFYLLDLPTFVPKGAKVGVEYYRIPELRPSADAEIEAINFGSAQAFDELWDALAALPVINTPSDPLCCAGWEPTANA